MVVMKLNFHSLLLGIHTKVNVILPTGRPVFYKEREKELYQVLWLLHGGTDDCNDFIQNTNIARYAEENKIAVILPEDNDAFFTDGYIQNGGLYFSYVTEELVKMCRSILPISDKREDNFVAGNSMGSGGAMKCAVLHPELYGAAVMLSGSGIRMHRADDTWVAGFLEKVVNGEDVSDYPEVEDPKRDVQMAIPIYNILRDPEKKAALPKMFFTCGGDDRILSDVKKAMAFYDKLGLEYFWEEIPGYAHEWDFWDMQLRKALVEWLPLKHAPIIPGKEEE
jgi:S-formylglutathione hydrolase FrmB